MKVLHIVRQFSPSVGGVERAVLATCRGLNNRGVRCDVVTLRRLWGSRRPLAATDVVDGVRTFRVPAFGGRRVFLAPHVLRFFGDYDLLHVHCIDFFVDFVAATRWYHRKPFVVSTHGGFFHTPWAGGMKKIYFHTVTRSSLKAAEKVICVSAHDDQLFAPIADRGKRVVIRNGIASSLLAVPKAVEPGLLLAVGRITAHKRLDRIVDVMPALRRIAPKARLVIVGRDWDGELRALRSRASSLGVADCVSFPGEVPDDVLQDYLSRAHAVLAPSEYEAFGIAVLEAMASGTVVVANNIDAFRELIANGRNGYLVDFANAQRAAEVLATVLGLSSDELGQIGERARDTATGFTWESLLASVEAVYRDIVVRRRGARGSG